MAASNLEKLASGLRPLSDAESREGVDNLVCCLEAYDQKGDAGLEAELSRIHPSPAQAAGLTKVPLGEGWPGSHGLRSEKSYLQTSPASSAAKTTPRSSAPPTSV